MPHAGSIVRVATSAVALVLATVEFAWLPGCATSPIRRGDNAVSIHGALKRTLETEGYVCGFNPDKSVLSCESAQLLDLNLAYLPTSNFVQVWATFTRNDDTLVSAWRSGPCAPVQTHIDRINGESISKIVCTDDSYRFEYFLWVPDAGLSDDDVHAFVDVLRAVVAEQLNSGFIKALQPTAPVQAPAVL